MDTRLTKSYYKIKEASEIIGVPQTTLRFWEKEFEDLKPKRSKSNHRYYTTADLETLQIINYLLSAKGLKIDAAKEQLRHNKKNMSQKVKIIEKLQEIKGDLELLLSSLNKRGKQ